jgi:scyllo-inositol 2-dehydrogenase (NADP+)
MASALFSSQPPSAANGNRKTLQAGIIGAGRMGITHLAIFGGHPDVRISAVADDSPIVTHALGRYRPDIALFKSYEEMLRSVPLNMVVIATPPHMHGAMIAAALDCGLSIFVEKPFTLAGDEARRLAARSRAVVGTHQVGYVNRFNDVFMTVKKLLKAGLLGRLISFRSDMFGRTVIRKEDNSGWRAVRKTGGGALYEFGSHAVDLAVHLFGCPDQVIGTRLTPIYSSHIEDMVRTTFLYNSGLEGSVLVNWSDESYRKPTNRIEVFGERGKITADQHELKIFLKEEAEGYVKGWNTAYITDVFTPVPFYVRGYEFTRQLFHFAELARAKAENIASFDEGAITQHVLDMILSDAGVVF